MKHKSHCTGLLHPTPFQWKFLGTTLQLYFPAFPNILSLRAPQRFFVLQKIRSKYLFGGGDLYRIVACSCFLFKFLSNKKPHKSGLPHKSLWTKSFSEILKSEVEVEKRSRNRNRSRLKSENEVEIEIEVENRSRNRNRSRQKKEVEVEIEVRNRSRSRNRSWVLFSKSKPKSTSKSFCQIEVHFEVTSEDLWFQLKKQGFCTPICQSKNI